MSSDIAWNYGTSVWQQRLIFDGPGWRLVRRSKEGHTDDALRRQRSAERVADIEHGDGVRFVRPSHSEDGAVYELSACEVAAGQLWPDLRVVGRELESVMMRLGAAVARLHTSKDLTADVEDGLSSPHLRRLRAHLDADPSTWAGKAIAELRPSVVAQVRRWLDELPTSGVLCHGGFALGSIFVDQGVQRIEVLTGEELMLSTPELDLGWMLGELTEFEFQAGVRGSNGLPYEGAAQWLIEGWTSVTGVVPDQRWIDKVIALRSFLRMCDVAETTHSAQAAASNVLFMTYLVERVGFLEQVPTQRHRAIA
ncbi:MAG: phosphotransferase [Actinomycetota bacterium]|nr:phosphotransferase [Actinomycetota bacterium]